MERYLEFRIDEQTTELKMEAFLKKNAGLTKFRVYKKKRLLLVSAKKPLA